MNSSPKTIYCFAPSGKVVDLESIQLGQNFLDGKGFEVRNLECSKRAFERFAGTEQERLDELHHLVQIHQQIGPHIALAVRGGYGMSRLLPRINWDALAKAVDGGLKSVGHSDITSLNLGLFAQTGRVSYAGPMLSYDFGKSPELVSKFTWSSFNNMLENERLEANILSNQSWLSSNHFQCEGVLWGGNLSIINSLLGTSYFPDKSLIKNGILFIEDINEHPYRVERMLLQLLHAGVLQSQQAILFGDFSGYKESPLDSGYSLNKCIDFLKSELSAIGAKTQILSHLPFGHCFDKLTLPVGKNCQIKANLSGFELKTI